MKQVIATTSVVESMLEIAWQFSARGVDGACCGELSLAEFRALQTAALYSDCSVQQIGKLLDFTKSGATRIVNRLEKQQLVTKVRSAEDGRVCCVQPTENGLDLLQHAKEITGERLGQALSKVSAQEQNSIVHALTTLAKVL
ncbi:MarR family transcriptional regulator [Halodesulfovibrio sp.]|uniref:MarR family winged helix-turn-helix transcriptional regulator n=1 Tax=Halodesulfovibrio sp. TaxID=1912772 RepID=UPI0025C3FFE8|nr:MarR family transcriptional regulator [Halodesulfovibrio sp.]